MARRHSDLWGVRATDTHVHPGHGPRIHQLRDDGARAIPAQVSRHDLYAPNASSAANATKPALSP